MKPIDIIFLLMMGVLAGSNIFDYFRPGVLTGIQFVNAVAIVMMGVMVHALSYKLAHVPIKEKYIKPSRRK